MRADSNADCCASGHPHGRRGRAGCVLLYHYTGNTQNWTVPDGVTQIGVDAEGAQGGGPYGGLGGWTHAVITVQPGDKLAVMVGGAGKGTTGGFNGGGDGGWNNGGVAGGGASDVRSGGDELGDRVVVAGGGGGSAPGASPIYGVGGSGGGLNGESGGDGSGAWKGGGGGGQNAGGWSGGDWGSEGAFGQGAGGGYFAGAGGGGWYGGGSGGSENYNGSPGGGGGGSGYATATATDVRHLGGVHEGDGAVVLTYPPAEAPVDVTSPASKTFEETAARQIYRVPTNAAGVRVEARGAQGADGGEGGGGVAGGEGGRTIAIVPVSPYQTLTVYPGGAGQGIISGFNGGGDGGWNNRGVAGGGASDVRIGGDGLADRIVVAGGGGGSNGTARGGAGGGLRGINGGDGDGAWKGGGGGTQSAGGEFGGAWGGNGAFGQGAGGGYFAGAGGGGWYGGGSGGSENYNGSPGAGGGGSGYVTTDALGWKHQTGGRAGNGSVTVTALSADDLSQALMALAADAPPGADAVKVADAADRGMGISGSAFLRKQFTVSPADADEAVLLAGSPDGEAPMWVSGTLTVIVTHQDGSTSQLPNADFTGCRLAPEKAKRTVNLQPLLAPGVNTVRVVFRRADCPDAPEQPRGANSDVYLVANGQLQAEPEPSDTWLIGSVRVGRQPAAGSFVQACADDGSRCASATSDDTGSYFIAAPAGEYTVTAFPPAAARANLRAEGRAQTSASGPVAHTTLALTRPALPADASLESPSFGRQTSGVPRVFWTEPTRYTKKGCPNGVASLTVSSSDPNDERRALPMPESPAGSGNYVAAIPPLEPLHGTAIFSGILACPPPIKARMAPEGGPAQGGAGVLVKVKTSSRIERVDFAGRAAPEVRHLVGDVYLITTPPGTGDSPVTAVLEDGSTVALGTYHYVDADPPSSDTGPASGGQTITINGSGFTEQTQVLFGETPAPKVEAQSPSRLVVTVPPGSGQQPVWVIDATGYGSASTYTYVGTPTAEDWERLAWINVYQTSKVAEKLLSLALSYQGAKVPGKHWRGSPPIDNRKFWKSVGWNLLPDLTAKWLGLTKEEENEIWGANAGSKIAKFVSGSGMLGATIRIYAQLWVWQKYHRDEFGENLKWIYRWAHEALIDPSGNIVDSNGSPVKGAQVTLLRRGDDGDYTPVPEGEPTIDPQINPQITADGGAFAWMAAAGTYRLRAESSACTSGDMRSVEAGPFTLPPPVTGLLLKLPCSTGLAPKPSVTSVSPHVVPANDASTVTLSGSGLGAATGVLVDGDRDKASGLQVLSPYAVRVKLPPGTGTADLQVVTPGGTSDVNTNDRITYIAVPDSEPPNTMITSGPSATIRSDSASFEFTTTEPDPGSSFECKLDLSDWETCSSPNGLTGLSDGSHTFSVRAIDSAGNSDPSPAVRSFAVDTSSAGPGPGPSLGQAPGPSLGPGLSPSLGPGLTGKPLPTLDQIAEALEADVLAVAKALRRLGIRKLVRQRAFTARGLKALLTGRFYATLTGAPRATGIARRVVLATGSLSVARAGRQAFKLKLTGEGSRLLRSDRRAKVTLSFTFRDTSGRAATKRATVSLRR